jgi:hypothetical protein
MSNENFWFRTLFKLKLYEVSGESFQRLFNDIASYRYPDFQAVAPYGNQGDGGNDGWFPDEKRYCQVYGKKANSDANLPYILKKATGDFDKLKTKWGQIDYYHFVYNDRFEGAPAPIGQELLELKKQHKLTEASVWDSRKLERLFMELDDDKKSCILGSIPVDIPFIDSRLVAELLKHLADNISPSVSLLNQTAPDFNEKIQFNGLTPPVSIFLKNYSYQTQDVDEFLIKRDIGLKQSIAIEMQEIYEESSRIITNGIDTANMRYVWMIEKLIPDYAKNHPHTLKAYREAAQVILAKYFEICDIYEHPSTVTSS